MPAKIVDLFDYVMARCDRSGGRDACWPWLLSCNRKSGYGRVKADGRNLLTHRIIWSRSRRRVIPVGKRVLHRCDNPPCCNPRHLKLGTQRANVRDMLKKGRRAPTHGERNPRAKLTESLVKKVYLDQRSEIEVHRATGIPTSTINHIRNHLTWTGTTSHLVAPERRDGRRRAA